MLKMIKSTTSLIVVLFFAGCSAQHTMQGAETVELVSEAPDKQSCKFIGDVVGSQGNWFTGDFTSNKNLVIGARNEMRNLAYKLGGNVVYVQDFQNTNAYGSLGTTNTTGVGKAYRCNY